MGRDIVALKVTQNAKTRTDNTRPAVLYNAMQHAREWLAGETCKRSLNYFTSNYGKTTPDGVIATELVNTRELWFVCVNNPDGYEYTFTPGNRLWRKNMADNNGNGVRGEAGRRRRHQPQPRHPLGLRQRGLLRRLPLGDLPRHRPGLRARDEGDQEALGHGRLRLQQERPHRGRAAAVAQRLPAVHAGARRQALRGLRGRRRPLGDRRRPLRRRRRVGDHGQPLRPGPQRRALHHQRRPDRRRLRERHPRLHARGLAAEHPERLGLRVPGRRGRHPGRVPAPQAVRARPRALGRRSGEPDLAPRQHGRELLRGDLRGLLRRPADRAGRGQEVARRRQAALPHQRRRGEDGADVEVPRRRALRPGARPLLPPPARHGHRHEPR